jgi:calcium/calmodulin-dependent protein kinase I
MEIYLGEVKETDEFANYFKFLNYIAAGEFGQVIHAIDLQDNSEIAVKIVDKKKCKNKYIAIKKEIAILQQLKHNNIVKFYGYVETDSKLFIKMEHIKGGTLKTFMEQKINNLNEEDIATIVKYLLEAVNYLHSRDISHRDIKPENIMFQDFDDLTSIKLIDFGLSNQDYEDLFQYDLCGTIIYMAPEQLEKRSYTKSVDIWSCGIVMYVLLNNGEHPVYKSKMSSKEYIKKMKSFKVKCAKSISQIGLNLLHKFLESEPSKRYTIDKCLKHPWITRKKYDKIPVTYLETWKISSVKNKFRELFMGLIFLLGYKKVTGAKQSKTNVPNSYINLLSKVSHEMKLKYMLKRDKYFEANSSSDDEPETKDISKPVVTFNDIIKTESYDTAPSFKVERSTFYRQTEIVRRHASKKSLKIQTNGFDFTEKLSKKKLTVYSPQINITKVFGFKKDGDMTATTNQIKLHTTKNSDTSTHESSPLKGKDEASQKKQTLAKTRTQELLNTKCTPFTRKLSDSPTK